jgi:hypothetical protein
MYRSRIPVSIIAAATVTALAAAALHATQSAPATTRPPVDPVVAEIRALRADLNERLGATMRAQLLVARLSVQEQRTNSVVRQLQEIELKLRENESAREQFAASMKMFGDVTKSADAQDNPVFGPLRASMDRIANADADLKAKQAEAMRQLAEEQARWTTINARLEELEQMMFGQRK